MLNVLEKLGLIESLPDDKRMTGFLLVNETDVVRVLPQDVTEGQISICFIWSDRGVSRSRQRLSLTGDGCLECPFCQRKATELLIFYYENYASCVTCSTALSEENRALYDAFLEREKASVK
jgi:hypothetical protein